MQDDFDDAVLGGLLADPEIDFAVAMAAALPDRTPEPASGKQWPALVVVVLAFLVAFVLGIIAML
jgi:hypothetical protein